MNNHLSYDEEINHPTYKQRVRYQANENARDLSGKLDVTCFLMAVEIQRLVAENNELKLLVKQTSDTNLDRVNYEIQIRDLMAQNQQLQKNNYLIGSDNERLKNLLSDLEATLQKYESDLRDYDPNWKRELEQNKKQLAQLQKKLGNDDVDDLRNQLNKLKKKCEGYEQQFGGKNPEDLQRMLDELRKKAKLYDDLKNKLGGMDPDTLAKKLKDLEKLQNQFGNPDDILKELEKLRKKAKEADDLKKELDKQQRENDRQKNDIGAMNDLKVTEYQSQKNAADLQKENGLLNSQLNDLKGKLRDMDQLKSDLDQLRDLLRKKDQEIAYLKSQLSDAQRQFQDAQNKLQDSLNKLQDAQRQMNDVQNRLRQAEQNNQKLQKDLDNCLDELDHADDQKAETGQLKDENAQLSQEVDQLKGDNDKLQDENENLRNKLNDLMRQMQDKDNKLRDLQGDLNKKNAELKDLGQKLKDANDKIDWIKKEFGLTDDDLDPRKRNSNGKNVKDSILFANIQPSNILLNYLIVAAENERLSVIIEKYNTDNEQLRVQVQLQKSKVEQLGQQLQQQLLIQTQLVQNNEVDKLKEYYENKIVMLTMELSRIRKSQTQSYQSIPISHQQQLRAFSAQNIDVVQGQRTKKEEDYLCLIVLMSAEIQQLRDANSSLLLKQPEPTLTQSMTEKIRTEPSYDNRTYSGYQGDNGSQRSYQYQSQVPFKNVQTTYQSSYAESQKYKSEY